MHVRFARPFIYVPTRDRRVSVKYPAGWSGPVRRECGELAKAAGALHEDPPADGATDPADAEPGLGEGGAEGGA